MRKTNEIMLVGTWSLGLMLLLAVSAPVSAGQVYRVKAAYGGGPTTNGQGWDTAFPTIQAGLNAAVSGDEVWVAAGVYPEYIQLKEGVALLGGFAGNETNRTQRNVSQNATIIENPARLHGDLPRQSLVTAPVAVTVAARLDGFVVRNGSAGYGAGVYSGGGSPVFANNLLTGNAAVGITGGGAAFCDAAWQLAPSEPVVFFTNVAQRLLQSRFGMSLDAISLYPTNDYTPGVHQIFQMAANLYDVTHLGGSAPFPSVFRPVFTNANGEVRLCGFVEAADAGFLTNRWLDLGLASDRALLLEDQVRSNANVFGQPVILGARKGLPNFNELSVETHVRVIRKLELWRPTVNSMPNVTNQMYLLGISNRIGVEAWNAYTNALDRPVRLVVSNLLTASIADASGALVWPVSGVLRQTQAADQLITSWPGAPATNSFVVPLAAAKELLPMSSWRVNGGAPFETVTNGLVFEQGTGFPVPDWCLHLTNRLVYALIETNSNRILDFVTLDSMKVTVDIAQTMINGEAFPDLNDALNPWRTNRLNDGTNEMVPTYGVINQILISMGHVGNSYDFWRCYSDGSVNDNNRLLAVERFRRFMIPSSPGATPTGLSMVAPFSPARHLYTRTTFQANDPLVHSTWWDLTSDLGTVIQPVIPYQFNDSQYGSNNLGRLNERYQPWGGRRFPGGAPLQYPASLDCDPALKDAGVRWVDDWDFPTEPMLNLRWLDRVHRGTPWQTIHLGAEVAYADSWAYWLGNAQMSPSFQDCHPTNDWLVARLFLTNHLGLPGSLVAGASPVFVNNTIAANQTSGDGGGLFVAPGAAPVLVNNIVAGNDSGIHVQDGGTASLRTNDVYGNTRYNYSGLSAGTGDIAADPRFVTTASGPCHLMSLSPCLEMGDESVLGTWLYADEPVRRQGLRLDLGAYELSPEDRPVLPSATWNRAGGHLEMRVAGFPGRSYILEVSTNLIDWASVFTNIAAGGWYDFADPMPWEPGRRFYRAVLSP